MVVKVSEKDIPLVVYITADDPTGCIFRFWNMWEQDRLNFSRDKYA